jgi:hypothetical protein
VAGIRRFAFMKGIDTTRVFLTAIIGTGVLIITIYRPIPASSLRVTIIKCTGVVVVTR